MRGLGEVRRITLGIVVVATVFIVPGFLDVTNLPKLLVLVVGAGVIVSLLLREGAPSRELRITYTWLAVFVVALAISAAVDGQHLYRALYGVWGRNDGLLAYASLAVVFAAVATSFPGQAARQVLFALAGTGAVEAFLGTAQHLAGTPGYWAKHYNPVMGSFGNPDFASAFLGVAAVALCAIAIMRDLPNRIRVAGAGFGALAALLTVLSGALQGTLALLVGGAVAVTAWAFNRQAPGRLHRLRRLLLMALAVAGAAGLAALFDRGPLAVVMQSANLQDRFYLWRAAGAMFAQHPWSGVGIDSYAEQFRIFRGADVAAGGGIGTTADAAHSVPLNLLAGGGLLVLVPYLCIALLVAWRGLRAIRTTEQPLLLAALLGAWAAYVASSCFSLDQLGVAVWGWALGGAIVGASRPTADAGVADGSATSRQRAVPVMQVGVLVLVVALLAWPLRTSAAVLSALSREPTSAAQRADAIQALSASVAHAPDPTLCQFAVYRLNQLAAQRAAIEVASTCVLRFPNRLELWVPIADGWEHLGQRRDAIAARRHTVALDPLNGDFKRLLAQDLAAQ